MDIAIVIVVVAAAALYAGRLALRALRGVAGQRGSPEGRGAQHTCDCASCPLASDRPPCHKETPA